MYWGLQGRDELPTKMTRTPTDLAGERRDRLRAGGTDKALPGPDHLRPRPRRRVGVEPA